MSGETERQHGYYWVEISNDPEIAEWDSGFWWRTGVRDPVMKITNVRVLSGRLAPPAADGGV